MRPERGVICRGAKQEAGPRRRIIAKSSIAQFPRYLRVSCGIGHEFFVLASGCFPVRAPAGEGVAGPLARQAVFLPGMALADLLVWGNKRIGDSAARLNLGGLLLRYNLTGLRLAQRLALLAAASALATAGLAVGMSKPALAEFEIQRIPGRKGRARVRISRRRALGLPQDREGRRQATTKREEPSKRKTRVLSGKATTLNCNTGSAIGGCSPRPSLPTSLSAKISM